MERKNLYFLSFIRKCKPHLPRNEKLRSEIICRFHPAKGRAFHPIDRADRASVLAGLRAEVEAAEED